MTAEGAEALPLALAGLVLAALVAFFLTPIAVRLATAVGAIDHPGERRVHREETPRGGGLAVAAGFVIVGLAVLWYDRQDALTELAFHHPYQEIVVLFGGAVVAAILGFVDDRFDLRARWQFLGQLILAGLVVWSGLEVDFVANPFAVGKIPLTGVFAVAFTAFWIVGMINSINWIDGLDGLSSGVAAIAAATLGGISLFVTPAEPLVGVLCFILAGALAGFLPWNFHPARIFVGTTGVFLIGYTLAVLSILGTAKVAVALLVLGVPIIDTFWIIVRRVAQGSSPFAPDRGHLHHRLLDLGLGQRQVVVLIYGMSALLAALSFLLSGRGQLYAFMGIVVGGGLVLYLLTTRAGDTSTTGLDASAYEDPPTTGSGRAELDADGPRARWGGVRGNPPRGGEAGAPGGMAGGAEARGAAARRAEAGGAAPGSSAGVAEAGGATPESSAGAANARGGAREGHAGATGGPGSP